MSERTRLLALGVLWAGVTAGMLAMPGCYGQNCESTSGNYGREPGEGRMIDANTWESSPMDGKWLHFPSQQIWFFDVPAWGERMPYNIMTYISPVEDPNVFHAERLGQNFTAGGGNLTQLSGVDKNRLVVSNGTCAEYFLRVVVELPRKPDEVPLPSAVDASIDANDAGADAADDGSTDAATD